MLGCAKAKVLGDGQEERDFIDVHDVHCHDDLLVCFKILIGTAALLMLTAEG